MTEENNMAEENINSFLKESEAAAFLNKSKDIYLDMTGEDLLNIILQFCNFDESSFKKSKTIKLKMFGEDLRNLIQQFFNDDNNNHNGE
jgi:hypothetical protein